MTEILLQMLAITLMMGGLYVAYMCGVSDGCKTNACFRGGKDVK